MASGLTKTGQEVQQVPTLGYHTPALTWPSPSTTPSQAVAALQPDSLASMPLTNAQ